MMKTKIAIIGIGKWGKNLLKEYAVQADVTWCAYKGDLQTKNFLEEFYPMIHITTSYEDIFNDPAVEAIVVATPTSTHFEIGKKVLEAGKHLFLEKPGCSDSSELEKLCEEAEKNDLIFTVGYEFVHHSAWQKIRELIPTKNIRSIHMEWFKWGTFSESTITNLLCHDISLLKCYTPDVIPKNISLTEVISDSDIIHITFNCSPFTSTSYINRVSPEKKKTITVVSDELTLIWNNNELFSIDAGENKLVPIEIDAQSAIHFEIKDFLQSITEKKKPRTDCRFALEVFKTTEKLIDLK